MMISGLRGNLDHKRHFIRAGTSRGRWGSAHGMVVVRYEDDDDDAE